MRDGVDYGLDYLERPEITGHEIPVVRGTGWKIVQWVSITLASVLVLGSLTAYGFYYKLVAGNIEQLDDEHGNLADEDKRPDKLNSSVNILVMGSDTREGRGNAKYGRTDGERSDTTILLHLSAGGEKAIGISFPRDSWVDLPQCKSASGQAIAAHQGMINSAFTNGGPYCTWNTIETLTQIRIDHFVKVDFSGFKGIVNALGGVEVCSPKAFTDPKAKLVIPKAGRQTLNGEQALGWVRTRYSLGDGSDLGRIQRQQQFMSAVIQKATSKGVMTDPAKMIKFVNAATKSLKTDKGFNSTEILDLATKVKGINTKSIKFVTVPWYYPTEAEIAANSNLSGRVLWKQEEAQELFAAIRRDNTLPKTEKTPQTKTQTVSAPAKRVDPSTVTVKVYNGTNQQGLAGRAVTDLVAKKYQASLGSTGVYKNGSLEKTAVHYGPGGEDAAAQLAKLVPGVVPEASPDGQAGVVYLYLGADYTGLGGNGSASIPKVDGEIKASDNICKKTA
ncbi:LCP family protein [Actinocorallia populi]|uniref:LCP family protein n=1 Tax=Actinocorallia populi TaxID=2079200 RepID=UPI000D08B033|nr:LCP family protein [Actinocorallia populi]